MKYYKKLLGERVYLSPMRLEDAEAHTKWMNDGAVSGYLGNFNQMISFEAERRVLENMALNGQNFSIVLLEGDLLLGNASLMEVDHLNRRATVGIFIGEREQRGQGYGAEALRLLLGYGFRSLNLHNIMLLVHGDNELGLACYKKVGFREFGRRRSSQFKDGGYVDVIHMDILEEEFLP